MFLNITPAAANAFARIIQESPRPVPRPLRVVARPNGLVLRFDRDRPGDLRLELEDDVVLVCDPESADRLRGRTLDAEHEGEEDMLVVV